jgi:predicted ATPase
VELFGERARERNTRFVLSNADIAVAERVCRRLDGLPLAIELAAARVRLLSLAQIEAHLDDWLRLFSSGSRTAPPRHRSLAAALAWSVDLLSEPERRLFLRLAVFAGSFSLEAAHWLNDPPAHDADASATLDLLERLVEKSLVTAESHDGVMRYRLLETVRAYGRERLARSGDHETTLRRHAAFCLQVAEAAAARRQRDQAAAFARLTEELDDLRAALAWSTGAAGEADTALRLVLALGPYWLARGDTSEGRSWVERALVVAAQDRSRTRLRVEALRLAANLARR